MTALYIVLRLLLSAPIAMAGFALLIVAGLVGGALARQAIIEGMEHKGTK